MSGTRSNTKSQLQTEGEAMANNLLKVLPGSVKSIPLGGQSLTPQQAQTTLQKLVGAFVAVTNAKIAVSDAIKARKDAEVQLRKLLAQLGEFLKLVLGEDTAKLTACGVHLSKPARQLSSEENALKAARNRATRQKNGTKGSTQKRKAAQAGQGATVALDGAGQPLPGPGQVAPPPAAPANGTPAGSPASAPTPTPGAAGSTK